MTQRDQQRPCTEWAAVVDPTRRVASRRTKSFVICSTVFIALTMCTNSVAHRAESKAARAPAVHPCCFTLIRASCGLGGICPSLSLSLRYETSKVACVSRLSVAIPSVHHRIDASVITFRRFDYEDAERVALTANHLTEVVEAPLYESQLPRHSGCPALDSTPTNIP